MKSKEDIKLIIENLRSKYDLDDYKASKAFIVAPFGQKYFDQSVQQLTASKAIKSLAMRGELLVVVITSKNCDTSSVPKIFEVIQIESIEGWPGHNSCQNRFIKWAIPFLFKNIKASIYIDSNVLITNSARKVKNLFKIIKQHKFINTKHSARMGWEDEYCHIKKEKRRVSMDKLEKQKIFFQEEKVSPGIACCQNKFLGRVHSSNFDALGFEILLQIFHFSNRDQLGLVYAIYKTGKVPHSFAEGDLLLTYWASRFDFKRLCFVQDKQYYKKLLINYFKGYLKLFRRLAFKEFSLECRQISVNTAPRKETIAVIVTCCGHLEYTKKCVESYYASINDDYNYILIILDDQSKDATKDFFTQKRKNLLNLCYLRFKSNMGVTRSWNYGARFALTKLKADYVFFANNDIIIPKGSISKLVSGLKKVSGLGIIGPLTNCPGFHENQDVRKFYSDYKSSDKITDIQTTADKVKNGRILEWGELNGFFFGGERKAFEKNMYAKFPRIYYFNPFMRDIENEREFQKRLRDTDMKILLASNVFVFHYKDISYGRFKRNKKLVYRA